MASEADLNTQIREYIRSLPNHIGKAIKHHAGPYNSEKGTPDLIICVLGQLLILESKKKKGGITEPIQLERIREWEECGAISYVVTDLQQVKDSVRQILTEKGYKS